MRIGCEGHSFEDRTWADAVYSMLCTVLIYLRAKAGRCATRICSRSLGLLGSGGVLLCCRESLVEI